MGSLEDYVHGHPDLKTLVDAAKARDDEWKESVSSAVKRNFGISEDALENVVAELEPPRLLTRALNSLRRIDAKNPGLLADPVCREMVKEISRLTFDMKKKIERHEKALSGLGTGREKLNDQVAVVVDFDEQLGGLVISGGLESLRRNRLFGAFLRKYDGELQSERRVVVLCSDADLATVYRTLERVFERIGISVGKADGLSKSMRAIRDDEQKFKEFSRLAAAIWHGDVDPEGLEDFTRTIAEACPSRTLYRRQLLSAYHLAYSQHSCNFSVPGSGKTTIVLAAYAFLKARAARHRHVNHLLAVGPLSSFRAWEDEFNALFGRKPKVKRISGVVPVHERHAYLRGHRYTDRNVEMTLTSYQSFMGAEEDFRHFLHTPGRRVMMVLDEAHYIKRDDGEWAASVLRTASLAVSRVVLTGTPAPNGYEDLHNLFRFIHPDRNIIGFPLGMLKAMTAGQLPKAVENLKNSVRPFLYSHQKARPWIGSDIRGPRGGPDGCRTTVYLPRHRAADRSKNPRRRRLPDVHVAEGTAHSPTASGHEPVATPRTSGRGWFVRARRPESGIRRGSGHRTARRGL